MIKDIWTIPFDNINYLCWQENGVRKHRQLTSQEEKEYFTSQEPEKYLNELCNKG